MTISEFRKAEQGKCDECGREAKTVKTSDDTGTFPVCLACLKKFK